MMNIFFITEANYPRCIKQQNKPLGQGLEKRLLYRKQWSFSIFTLYTIYKFS